MEKFLVVITLLCMIAFAVSLIVLLITFIRKKSIKRIGIISISSLVLSIVFFVSFGIYTDHHIDNNVATSSDSGYTSSSDESGDSSSSATEETNSITSTSNTTDSKTENQRQAQGKATDLGAGTFTVGKDIPQGVYDATPADGQGNFIITNASSMDLDVNSILGTANGMGVSKVRVKLVKDEQIQLQSINKTHFEPVTTQFVTDHKAVSLYSGRFVVGEDIGKGRYTAVPGSGTGNFIVYDKSGVAKTNEILGGNGVKQVTIDLNDGDIVTIVSLNQVNFTPVN